MGGGAAFNRPGLVIDSLDPSSAEQYYNETESDGSRLRNPSAVDSEDEEGEISFHGRRYGGNGYGNAAGSGGMRNL